MTAYILLTALGTALVLLAWLVGGRPAAIGGAVALGAQLWAVALLRPAMRAPNPQFMARWLGGMATRALALAALVVWSVSDRASIPPLPAVLGYLAVLLPLLFLETRFLR